MFQDHRLLRIWSLRQNRCPSSPRPLCLRAKESASPQGATAAPSQAAAALLVGVFPVYTNRIAG